MKINMMYYYRPGEKFILHIFHIYVILPLLYLSIPKTNDNEMMKVLFLILISDVSNDGFRKKIILLFLIKGFVGRASFIGGPSTR